MSRKSKKATFGGLFSITLYIAVRISYSRTLYTTIVFDQYLIKIHRSNDQVNGQKHVALKHHSALGPAWHVEMVKNSKL